MNNASSPVWIFAAWCCLPPLLGIIGIPVALWLDRSGRLDMFLDRLKRKGR